VRRGGGRYAERHQTWALLGEVVGEALAERINRTGISRR
jgi:hypothetical protein